MENVLESTNICVKTNEIVGETIQKVMSGTKNNVFSFFNLVKRLFFDGTLSLVIFSIVLVGNVLFYDWTPPDTFYLVLEITLFFFVFLSRFWHAKTKMRLLTGVGLFIALYALDMMFYLLILFNEGVTDYIGLVLFVFDVLGITSLIMWLFVVRLD